MAEPGNQAIDAGYELSAERLRVWLGNVELRLESQWNALLWTKHRGPIGWDLVRLGGSYDEIAARLDLHAGMLGFQLAVTGRFAGSRGELRVRQAAAEAAAVVGRLSR